MLPILYIHNVWLIILDGRDVWIKGEIRVTRHIGSDIAIHIIVLP